MPIIAQQSLDLLVSLINSANPSLPVAVTKTNVKFGTPTAQTPSGSNIQNTNIRITALNKGQFIGNNTLQYRRLDLGTLFRSVPIAIYKYSAAGASNLSPYKISDLLNDINAKYGLSLVAADIVDANLPVPVTTAQPAIGLAAGTANSSITVNAQSTSYGYVGSFTLYWVQAPQDISNLITVASLENGRVWPGNTNTVTTGLYVPDLDVFSLDFTDALNACATNLGLTLSQFITNLTSAPMGSGTTAAQNAQAQFFTQLQTLTGINYNKTSAANIKYGLLGTSLTQAALPATTLPEADSKYFNNALYLDLLPANSWGAGRMIFHYNV